MGPVRPRQNIKLRTGGAEVPGRLGAPGPSQDRAAGTPPHPPRVPRCTSPAPLIAAWARQRPRRGPGADPNPTTAWERSPAHPSGSPIPAAAGAHTLPTCPHRNPAHRLACSPHFLLFSCPHILGAGLGLGRWGHLVRPMWGGCQPALRCCPSSHMAQGGRWPGSWPGPQNGVEGWVPTGAKPVSRSPSPGSLHNLGVGAGHGGVTRPSRPRIATGHRENPSL